MENFLVLSQLLSQFLSNTKQKLGGCSAKIETQKRTIHENQAKGRITKVLICATSEANFESNTASTPKRLSLR